MSRAFRTAIILYVIETYCEVSPVRNVDLAECLHHTFPDDLTAESTTAAIGNASANALLDSKGYGLKTLSRRGTEVALRHVLRPEELEGALGDEAAASFRKEIEHRARMMQTAIAERDEEETARKRERPTAIPSRLAERTAAVDEIRTLAAVPPARQRSAAGRMLGASARSSGESSPSGSLVDSSSPERCARTRKLVEEIAPIANRIRELEIERKASIGLKREEIDRQLARLEEQKRPLVEEFRQLQGLPARGRRR